MNVEFSIEATGENLQFQWQKDGSNLVNTGKYRGIYTDSLDIVAVEGSDEGDYRCLVENDVGRLFSDVALLSFGKLLAFAIPAYVVKGATKSWDLLWVLNSFEKYAILQECYHFQHNLEVSHRATKEFI